MDRIDIAARMLPFGPEGSRVLDACTPLLDPVLVKEATARGWEYVACDIAPRKVKITKVDLIDRRTLEGLGKFYVVLSTDTLEHIQDWKLALANIISLTTDWLILAVPVGVVTEHDNDLNKWYNREASPITPQSDPAQWKIGHLWNLGPSEVMSEIERNGLFTVWMLVGYRYIDKFPSFFVGAKRL